MADIGASLINNLDTVPKRIKFLAENCSDKELFVFYEGDKRTPFTCEQVLKLAGRFANRLRHRYGFTHSDVISNTLPNSPERMITDLGINLAGCTCMNGQILLADGSDLFLSAKNSRCKGIVMKPAQESSDWRVLNAYVTGNVSGEITTLSCDKVPDLTTIINVSRTGQGSIKPFLKDLEDSTEDIFLDPTVSPQDILYVFTTSGSTGYSKLVPRTQTEMIDMAKGFGSFSDAQYGTSVFYSDRNLGWTGGYPFTSFCFGEKRVLQDMYNRHELKTGKEMWNAIYKERCTLSSIRLIDVERVLKYVESIGGTDYKMKGIISTAQPVTKSQVSSQLAIADAVIPGYGSTEANYLAMGFIYDANVDDFFCGKPTPGVVLRIIDDNGDECPPRQTGTILAKGGLIFKGYFNRLQDPDPNTVKCFTKDGWFNTEDLGFWDEEGNIYVLGRNKDTIMYGSVVLYPGWLETEILRHPDIADAVVLPVSDPIRFHEICACVTPVSGCDFSEEQLKAYCESIFIADLASDQTPMPKYFMHIKVESIFHMETSQHSVRQRQQGFASYFGHDTLTNVVNDGDINDTMTGARESFVHVESCIGQCQTLKLKQTYTNTEVSGKLRCLIVPHKVGYWSSTDKLFPGQSMCPFSSLLAFFIDLGMAVRLPLYMSSPSPGSDVASLLWLPGDLVVLNTFPETQTGKPDKQLLRKLAEQRFGNQLSTRDSK